MARHGWAWLGAAGHGWRWGAAVVRQRHILVTLSVVPDAAESEFVRTSTGYEFRLPTLGLAFEARQVHYERGSLYAMVAVLARVKGVRTLNGSPTVTEQKIGLSTGRSRKDLAVALADRAPGIDIDWAGLVEDFSLRVMAAEREGKPYELVGQLGERPDSGYAVEPYLPKGKTAVFFGPGGATKGFLMIGICVSIATGKEIIPGFRPQLGCPLYLDWESDLWDADDRVKRVARGAGIKPPAITYREAVVPITQDAEDIQKQVVRGQHDFVVVDSVGMAMSANREGGDASESTKAMFQVLRSLGTTTALVDHVVGAESAVGSSSSRPYGSIYKTNLARNTYEIRPLPPLPGDEAVHITLKHAKSNMSRFMPTLGIKVKFVGNSVVFEQEPVRQVVREDDSPISLRDSIRQMLTEGPLSPEELADESGRKPDSIARVLRRYSTSSPDPRDRQFNRLPGGRWEIVTWNA